MTAPAATLHDVRRGPTSPCAGERVSHPASALFERPRPVDGSGQRDGVSRFTGIRNRHLETKRLRMMYQLTDVGTLGRVAAREHDPPGSRSGDLGHDRERRFGVHLCDVLGSPTVRTLLAALAGDMEVERGNVWNEVSDGPCDHPT